jgi:hypothetical protein
LRYDNRRASQKRSKMPQDDLPGINTHLADRDACAGLLRAQPMPRRESRATPISNLRSSAPSFAKSHHLAALDDAGKTRSAIPFAMKQPRRSAFALLQMPSRQIEALKRWLTVENVPYEVAAKRLKEKFGVETSHQKISLFWQRVCRPHPPRILLELHLEKCHRGWRVTLLQAADNTSAHVLRKKLKPKRERKIPESS